LASAWTSYFNIYFFIIGPLLPVGYPKLVDANSSGLGALIIVPFLILAGLSNLLFSEFTEEHKSRFSNEANENSTPEEIFVIHSLFFSAVTVVSSIDNGATFFVLSGIIYALVALYIGQTAFGTKGVTQKH